MPYPLTAEAEAKINSRDNTSLTLFVELIIGVKIFKYSTVEIFGAKKGLKVSNSVLELLNSSGQTGSLPISIIDKDGSMADIIMNDNIMKQTVNVYVVFEDLTWDDRVLIFSGKAETPFKWNENTRIVQFNCLPHQLEGKIPGPIVFGDMPGVHVIDDLNGLKATTPLYHRSSGKRQRNRTNISERNGHFQVNIDIPEDMQNVYYKLIVDKVLVYGKFLDSRTFFCEFGTNTTYAIPTIVSRDEGDLDFDSNNTLWVSKVGDDLAGKYLRIKMDNKFKIFIADEAPTYMDENEDVFLQSTFLIAEGSGTDTEIIPEEVTDDFFYTCKCTSHNTDTGKITIDKAPNTAYGEPILLDSNNGDLRGAYGEYPLHYTGDMYNDYAEHWATKDGARVRFYDTNRETVISVLPSNYVLNVFDADMVLQIPDIEYTIALSPQTTITRLGIESMWCSVSSSVGPNIVDIIKYIINNYTTLTFDTTTYAALHALHTDFPVGFYYTKETKVGTVIADICKQACLEYTIYSDTFYLKDATQRQLISSDLTLDNSKLELGSVRWDTTRSKDLVTDLTGNWSETEYPDHIEREYKVENNEDLFGEIIGSMDFPIYHAEGSIKRAIDFYIDKRSNVWERVAFSCFLYAMNMYLYERVDTTLPEIGAKSGIITEFDFNVLNFSTKLMLWTGRSITGGIGYIDSSGYDGSYTLEQIDSNFLRLMAVENNLVNKEYSSKDFLPALVPYEGVQLFYRFMQQNGVVNAVVQGVYQQAIVIKLTGVAPSGEFTEKFGTSIAGANFMCAYPAKLTYDGMEEELANLLEPDSIAGVYFNQYNQAYLTTLGHKYFITPNIRVGEPIEVMFSPAGFVIPFDDYGGSKKRTMCNFEIMNKDTYGLNDSLDILDDSGLVVS